MASNIITDSKFEALMENIGSYKCTGWSRNAGADEDKWDTLSFKYDGSEGLGLDFTLAHPYSRLMDCINYNAIEVRFSKQYPFKQEWYIIITNIYQVKRLQEAVAEQYRSYRENSSKKKCAV